MFRFTIRDVLWLMVVAAMACAWGVSSRRWSDSLEASERKSQAFWLLARKLNDRMEDARQRGLLPEPVDIVEAGKHVERESQIPHPPDPFSDGP